MALAIILLLAAYLRAGQPEIVEFKRDEANLSLLALDFARGGEFPLLGIGSSVGFPNAPVNVWVLSIPYFFSSDPALATQFVGLLNVAAVALTYWLGRRYAGPVAGLGAALMFAASPWGVIFARKIWAQNMLPFFVVATFAAGFAGFVERRRWGQWVFLPLVVITGQIHYGAFVIVPAVVYLLWRGRSHWTRAFALSVIPALLLTMPYFAGLMRADLLSPSAVGDALESSSEGDVGLSLTFKPVEDARLLLGGAELHALAGVEVFQDYLATVPDVYPLFDMLAAAVGIAATWLVVRAIRYRDIRTPVDVTLLLWLVFPVIAFMVTWTPFFIHYLIPMLPPAFLILGFALHDLVAWLRVRAGPVRGTMGVSGLTLVGIALLQAWLLLALLDFLAANPTPGAFGTPLRDLNAVRTAVLDRDAQQVIGSFVDGEGEEPVWAALLYEVPLVRFEDPATRVYPPETAVILEAGCAPVAGAQVITTRDGCYRLSSRTHDDLLTAMRIPPNGPVRFANGVEITGYHREDGCLELRWRIERRADEDYLFAVHFFDESDTRIAQADGLSWPGVYWRPGDVVVRRFCADIEDAAAVGIGMYTYDGERFYNVDLLDSNGVPAGQMVRLPLSR